MKGSSSRFNMLSILILGALIVVSIWFGSVYASSEAFHHRDISYLEEKKNNAKALSASASAASVLVSMLPEDTATPLANQIADIGRNFLIVLSALAAEQFLLTITGKIAFCWIIPIALGILILFVLFRRKLFLQIGVKLALAGCVLYLLVPVTLRVTRLVDGPYEEAVDNSLRQSREIEDALRYNESGVVMPGMNESEALPETETERTSKEQTAVQTEARSEVQTQTRSEAPTEARSEVPTEARTEALTAVHTETQTEVRTEEDAQEPEKQTEKKAEKKTKKKAEKKQPWYERLWQAVTGTASDAVDTVKQVPEKVSDTASEVAQKVSDTASDAMQKISDTASEVAEKASDTASDAMQKVSDAASDAVQKVSDTASDAVQKVSDAATAAAGKIMEAEEKAEELAAMVPQIPQMAADLLNSLIDAFVLMIVTTCVLPIAILIGLLWATTQVLNINPDWEKMPR